MSQRFYSLRTPRTQAYQTEASPRPDSSQHPDQPVRPRSARNGKQQHNRDGEPQSGRKGGLRTGRDGQPRRKGSRSATSVAKQHGYIPGLDGLRAFAVLAVIAYHIWPGIFRGGFLGVDIFFVISGFLITTLLLREENTRGYINLRQFWVRRARRLIPAFVLLIITVVPIAWAVNSDLIVGIGRQILGALTFSTNWLEIAHGSSYFDSTAPLLLKNFWSLAIEEQFYLVWPIAMLLILVFAHSLKSRVAISGSLMMISAILMMVLYNGENQTRLYYGTDTHIFGLCAGITLAFIWADHAVKLLQTRHWKSFHALYGWSSLVTLILFIFVLPAESAYAYLGGMFVASIATVFVIAEMLYPRSFIAQLAELGVVRVIGTRSYGLYLWHWPLLVLVAAAYPVAIDSGAYLVRSMVAIVITFIIVEFSYRFVETPIRHWGYREALQRIRYALTTTLLAKIVGAVIAALTIATVVAVIVAPEKTSTQEMIESSNKEQAALNSNAKKSDADEPGTAKDADDPEKTTGAGKSGNEIQRPPKVLSENLDTTVPNAYEVSVIGDSMVSASRTGIIHAMPGINVTGEPSTQWTGALDMISQAVEAQSLGRVVVLDFGTNGGVNDPDVVRDVLDALGPERMIMLVNVYSPSTFVNRTNEILAQVVVEYPNVELIDWYGLVSQQPDLLQVDATHTSIAGANAYGKLLKDSITNFATELSKKRGVEPGEGWLSQPPPSDESEHSDAPPSVDEPVDADSAADAGA